MEPNSGTALASRRADVARPMSDAEGRAVAQGYEMAHSVVQRPARPPRAARPVSTRDDAVTHARAARISSTPKLAIFGGVTLGLLALAILFNPLGWAWGGYVLLALLLWGGYSLRALERDRALGLHHSSAGVEHRDIEARESVELADIDSRERVAKYVADQHFRYLEMRNEGGWE